YFGAGQAENKRCALSETGSEVAAESVRV
ncbi:MAG: hypothetical protein QOF15_1147, partial [Mycobacterium sp.]|nr:hypothetical protein [Mycobacterium sp.]